MYLVIQVDSVLRVKHVDKATCLGDAIDRVIEIVQKNSVKIDWTVRKEIELEYGYRTKLWAVSIVEVI